MPESVVAAALIVAGTALAMEAVAIVAHRFLMHGPGWGWHRSHHEPAPGRRLERNDLYALAPAALAIGLMLAGQGARWPLYWAGIGMTLYGALYFVVHDGLVHRRWPLDIAPRGAYLKRLVQAHRLHHAVQQRDGCVSFGFLYAPPAAKLAAELRARRRGAAPPARRAAALRAQSAAGLVLAALIVAAWLALLGYAVFVHEWTPAGLLLAPLLVALICWLDVGLFIVAHDAMHASLAPSYRRLNRGVGRLCLALYAGFSLDRFAPRHFEHHRQPGSAADPDFSTGSARFWPWYAAFMRQYFGWREALGLAALFVLLVVALDAPVPNLLVFWALPAVLSSLQLFAFGTWLPHRRDAKAFADRHNARSNDYGWLGSLLTCFHFGYHHEHHLRPDSPWWRLPAVRRERGISSGAPAASTGLRGAPEPPTGYADRPCSPQP